MAQGHHTYNGNWDVSIYAEKFYRDGQWWYRIPLDGVLNGTEKIVRDRNGIRLDKVQPLTFGDLLFRAFGITFVLGVLTSVISQVFGG